MPNEGKFLKFHAKRITYVSLQFSELMKRAIHRSVREMKNEINELKHFIEEAENTLGAEPVDFQRRYLDKKKQQDEFRIKLGKLRKMHDVGILISF